MKTQLTTLALTLTALLSACGGDAALDGASGALAPDSMTLKIYGPAAKLVVGAKTLATATADLDADGFEDLVKLIDNAGARAITIQRGERDGLSAELFADHLPADASRIAAGNLDREPEAEIVVVREKGVTVRRGIEMPVEIDLDF